MTVKLIDKINAIANTFEKAGCPLSYKQQAVMAGCMTAYSDKTLTEVCARAIAEVAMSGIMRDLHAKPRDTPHD